MRSRRKAGRPRGHVFAHGAWWWVQYRINGERVRKNTNVPLADPDGREQAEKILADALAKADLLHGQVAPGRLTFEQLGELVRQDYVRQRRRSLGRALRSLAQLAKHFAGKRVEQIAAGLDGYVDARLAAVKSGTVQLEMAALKRAFSLALKKKLVTPAEIPSFPTLAPADVREGFFEREDFERVVAQLPGDVADLAWLAYFTGMRRGEVVGLAWANVDRKAKVLRLNKTKNGKPRTLAYAKSPEIVALIERRHEARLAVGRDGVLTPWVFHRGGEPVRDFRGAWATACEKAGVPGRLFHDLRRTAVRNLVRAGNPDGVVMAISGHKTRSVFDRYNITSEADVADAFGRLSSHSSATAANAESADDAATR